MSSCYAYRKNTNCYETLEKHCNDVVHCIRNRWELNGLKKKVLLLQKRSSDIHSSNNYDNCIKSLVEEMLIYAGYIHDFGKLSYAFQEECIKNNYCTAFPGHYIISARFAYTVLRDVCEKKNIIRISELNNRLKAITRCEDRENYLNNRYMEVDLYLSLIVLPILLHHYAQVSERSMLESKHFRETSIELNFTCIDEYIKLLENVLNNNYIKTEFMKEVFTTTIDLLRNSDKVEDKVGLGLNTLSIGKEDLDNTRFCEYKIITESAVGLLNICDGSVAYINRKCLE